MCKTFRWKAKVTKVDDVVKRFRIYAAVQDENYTIRDLEFKIQNSTTIRISLGNSRIQDWVDVPKEWDLEKQDEFRFKGDYSKTDEGIPFAILTITKK